MSVPIHRPVSLDVIQSIQRGSIKYATEFLEEIVQKPLPSLCLVSKTLVHR